MTTTAAAPTTLTLRIDGLSCGACEHHASLALSAVPGVRAVEVDRRAGTAVVHGAPTLTAESLIDAVRLAGYDARMLTRATMAEPASGAAPGGRCGCCEVTA